MSGKNGLEPPDSSGRAPSGTEPLEQAMSSSETDARTFIQKTQSESGQEGQEINQAPKTPTMTVGTMLGPYQIVRKLGQGGMGAVYEAQHVRLKKTFAVKVLPPERMKSPALVARFDREMAAVGRLDHPHIVRATDAGEFQGTHYLTMEYIEGTDLSVLVKERGVLSVRDACKAIRQAAMGLQHAHEHGLVHRDIKPSNLFLTKSGQVKILDLGLARLGADDEANAGLTSSGQMLGTPDYMAPEQWDDTRSADARADLYSLGCTLGFLLTGKAPFASDKPRSFLHIMKAHADAAPPDLAAARKSVPAELNAIFQRLLAKKPEDRFQTAAEVVTALEPFTRRAGGSPASSETDAAQRSRHAPRDEPNASSTPISEPTLPETQSSVRPVPDQSSTSTSRSAHRAERDGDVDATEAAPTTSILAPSSRTRLSAGDVDDPSITDRSAAAPRVLANAATTRRRVIVVAGLVAFVVLAGIISSVGRGTRPSTSELANSKSQNSESSASPNPQLLPTNAPSRIEPLTGPFDRPLLVRPDQPMSVHALAPRPEKIPGLRSWSIELAGMHSPQTFAIAVSSKGDLIATGSYITGKISLWDRDGNYQRALLGHEGGIYSLDFSRDGRWLASTETGNGVRGFGGITARLWNVETGALHGVIPLPSWGNKIAFSPSGQQLVVSVEDQSSFTVIDLVTGRSRGPLLTGNIGQGISWSPDGAELACSHGDNHLRVWDAKKLNVLRDVECSWSKVLAWSPDGRWLAMRNGDDEKIAIRDAKTLELMNTFGKIVDHPHGLSWLPDSKRLVVAAAGQNSVFDAATGVQLAKVDLQSDAVAILDEGQQAVFESHGRLHFYDTSTGQKLREGPTRQSEAWSCLSPNGRDVFAQTNSSENVFVFDAATGECQRRFAVSSNQVAPEPAPDGKQLALRHFFGIPSLELIDSQTGAKRRELSHGDGNVTRVAWSPDGKWLTTGATDKLVRVWNVATGKIEHELARHAGTIWSLAWSPDGIRLASAAEDKTVRLWNPLAGKLVATYDQFPEAMRIEAGHFQSLAWTTDSRRLWIALTNNIVPLDVDGDVAAFAKNAGAALPDRTQPRTLASAATVRGTFGPLENFSNGNSVTFLNTSPDGRRLLTRELYGWTFVRGRDAQDRRLLGQRLGHTAQWHPDSRRFLGWEPYYGTVGVDVETNRRLGLLIPWLTGDHWLCLGPTGHYRGSPGVEDQFVYVAMLEDGSQRTYTPAEFAKTFGWKNDPDKAELLGK